MTDTTAATNPPVAHTAETTAIGIILAISFCHLLNDMMQSLLSAIYPILKDNYHLDFWQIGLLTFTFQITASILQPVIGMYTDKRPMPYSLPVGMGFSLVGLVLLAIAHHYPLLLAGAACVGMGSSIFHPESSRVARLASGGRHGLAQSLFQVGGNFGSAVGPLLAAFIVLPRGQGSIAWFSIAALIGMFILWRVGDWYARYRSTHANRPSANRALPLPRRQVAVALTVLAILVFTKYVYMASLTSYYTFYTISEFGVSVQASQLLLFLFLGAVAAGTILGGPIGDRIGARAVIWFSILGVLPFTLAMPYANLPVTAVLTVVIGFILASAFPAIVVFAQELVPGRVGMIAGLFFGFAFGVAGIAAAALGLVADAKGISFVYTICSYLPLLGLLAVFLPNIRK
ncbi:MFS transporter [Phyllobacterium leguminum]|uniref:FSR family fosmidomycin resistance protein-like MFS transporter n=1 Tax=Phyllobacterium leguminum TaxID=314237 RepID=A0A318T3D4_9HYPH|nr:MFS transporter [Phyllobacterium leguminum]PYE88453.1 FSR family fosmidomycin resistance protein-like MFS transporter [Phyllobacterium leguminum]